MSRCCDKGSVVMPVRGSGGRSVRKCIAVRVTGVVLLHYDCVAHLDCGMLVDTESRMVCSAVALCGCRTLFVTVTEKTRSTVLLLVASKRHAAVSMATSAMLTGPCPLLSEARW